MEALLAPDAATDGGAAEATPLDAKPIKGISLILAVLGGRLKRLFTRARS
jgi:hypothetical protein